MLEETALGDRGKDRFRSYSLGMKQRLAIAATLLKTPDLLIFDEPTNGLDPAGIREIRTTMRSLGEQGKTVLVSSHILAEVEQVADSVSIIGHGRLLAAGPVGEVIGQQGATSVRVGVADPDAAERVLRAGGLTASAATPGYCSSTACRTRPRSPGGWPTTTSTSTSSCRCGPTWSRPSCSSPPEGLEADLTEDGRKVLR